MHISAGEGRLVLDGKNLVRSRPRYVRRLGCLMASWAREPLAARQCRLQRVPPGPPATLSVSRHPGGPGWPGPAGPARRRTPAAPRPRSPRIARPWRPAGVPGRAPLRGPRPGRLDQRGPPVGGMRAAHYELRVLQRIHHRGHVPRADPKLDTEIPHDRRAAAVQRLEQPEPGVAETAAGPALHPAYERGREADGLGDSAGGGVRSRAGRRGETRSRRSQPEERQPENASRRNASRAHGPGRGPSTTPGPGT